MAGVVRRRRDWSGTARQDEVGLGRRGSVSLREFPSIT